MKELRIVTMKELGPVASLLNVRFTAFIVRLAEVMGIDPVQMVEQARQILAEAEIDQAQ